MLKYWGKVDWHLFFDGCVYANEGCVGGSLIVARPLSLNIFKDILVKIIIFNN